MTTIPTACRKPRSMTTSFVGDHCPPAVATSCSTEDALPAKFHHSAWSAFPLWATGENGRRSGGSAGSEVRQRVEITLRVVRIDREDGRAGRGGGGARGVGGRGRRSRFGWGFQAVQ